MLAPGTKNAARYVAISTKISSAISPDSHETSPSHLGRATNRRTNKPDDAHRAGHSENRRKVEIESAHSPRRIEKAKPEDRRAVIQRDQRKGAERPEDQRVGKARQRPLADDLGLEASLPRQNRARACRWGRGETPGPFSIAESCARIGPNRRQNPYDRQQPPAPANSSFSAWKKCWGSAKVGRKAVMIELDFN